MKNLIIACILLLPLGLIASTENSKIEFGKSFLIINKSRDGGKLFSTIDGSLIKDLSFDNPVGLSSRDNFIFPLTHSRAVIVNGNSINLFNPLTGESLLKKVCYTCFDPGYLSSIKPLSDGNFLIATAYNPETMESARVIKVDSSNGQKIFEYAVQSDGNVKRKEIENLVELPNGRVLIENNIKLPDSQTYIGKSSVALLHDKTGKALLEIDGLVMSVQPGDVWCQSISKKNLLCEERYTGEGARELVVKIVDSYSGEVLNTQIKNIETLHFNLPSSGFVEKDGMKLSFFSENGSLIKSHQSELCLAKNLYSLQNGNLLCCDDFGILSSYQLFNGKTGELVYSGSLQSANPSQLTSFSIKPLKTGDALVVLDDFHFRDDPPLVINGRTGKQKNIDIELGKNSGSRLLSMSNGNFAIEFAGEKTVLVDGESLEVLAEVEHKLYREKIVKPSRFVNGKLVVLVKKESDPRYHPDYEVHVVDGTTGAIINVLTSDSPDANFYDFNISSWGGAVGGGKFVLRSTGRYDFLVMFDVNSGEIIGRHRMSQYHGYGYQYFTFFSF